MSLNLKGQANKKNKKEKKEKEKEYTKETDSSYCGNHGY